MRPATASRLARLAPVLMASALLLGACVTTAAPGWTFEPPPSVASPAASASGSAGPSGSAAPSASASAATSASASASAAQSPSASASAGASASPSSGSSDGTTIKLSAVNIGFDQAQLEAPAGQAFHIAFTNNDASTQHNVQIKAADGSDSFKGSLLTGPGSTTYDIPALSAGTYTFSCVVHPSMTGTLTVK
ncbi:MAG TPA: cupredoxin domain-containing protein [Candidatus Limnocylindrales bacterium]